MEEVLNWFKENPDVLGFGVATVIFLFTILLVARKAIGFFITLLFLTFALVSGFLIVNQDVVRDYLEKKNNDQELTEKLYDAYDILKQEWEEQKEKLQDFLEENE